MQVPQLQASATIAMKLVIFRQMKASGGVLRAAGRRSHPFRSLKISRGTGARRAGTALLNRRTTRRTPKQVEKCQHDPDREQPEINSLLKCPDYLSGFRINGNQVTLGLVPCIFGIQPDSINADANPINQPRLPSSAGKAPAICLPPILRKEVPRDIYDEFRRRGRRGTNLPIMTPIDSPRIPFVRIFDRLCPGYFRPDPNLPVGSIGIRAD